MNLKEVIQNNLENVLTSGYIPELGNLISGKVRDNHVAGDKMIMVATDRISCFDVILKQEIPFKGQVLTQTTYEWFKLTEHIVPNHLINLPDPNVMVVTELVPYSIEVVVRRFLTGSAWQDYKNGSREKCGVKLPNGLKQNHRFDEPIITPTTKAKTGHDEDITKKYIIERKLVPKEEYEAIETIAVELFKFGEEQCKKAGLVLVDTKFEFAPGPVLVDEIFSMDSSRFWSMKDYERWSRGEIEEIEEKSKEKVRKYLRSNNFTGKAGQVQPDLTPDVIVDTALTYIDVYEKLFHKKFEINHMPVEPRVVNNLRKAGLIQGMLVPIIAGSESDDDFVRKIKDRLEDLNIPYDHIIRSNHRSPAMLEETVKEYNKSIEPLVFITVAGRSNGLSGAVAALTPYTVIACPPYSEKFAGADIYSSLRLPGGVTAVTILEPKDAATAAAKIFSNNYSELKRIFEKQIDEMQERIKVKEKRTYRVE